MSYCDGCAVTKDDKAEIARLTEQTAALREENARLRVALTRSTGELEYWLKTYRSHSWFMNATHLFEKEMITKSLADNRALLADPEGQAHE